MINQTILRQIQLASVAERLQLVEFIVESLKQELSLATKQNITSRPRFTAKTISLGRDVRVDRDELYAERR